MSKTTKFLHYEKWLESKNAPRDLVRWLKKHPDFTGEITIDLWDTFCGEEQIDDWHIHITSKEVRDE